MLLALFVILTITFAAISTFEYIQSNTLRTSGSEICQDITQFSNAWTSFSVNATNTLNQQIQNDRSIISILNSNKPTGYANMTSTLTTQINQDKNMIQLISPPVETVAIYVNPCRMFNQP